MQALGNDFVVIDGIHQSINFNADEIKTLADRHRGIGFDQLLLLESSTTPGVDFRYRIFNADGGEVAQCGNGARCMALFIRENGLSSKPEVVVETLEGKMRLHYSSDNRVSVSLGVPRFEAKDIPHKISGSGPNYPLDLNGHELTLLTVNVGNPHAVIKVEHLDRVDIDNIGRALNSHSSFPEGVNVGFLNINPGEPNILHLRVFERGVGETLACGSGACAAAVIALSQGWCQGKVTVKQPGGDLEVSWDGEGHEVWLTGPAEKVYSGQWGVNSVN